MESMKVLESPVERKLIRILNSGFKVVLQKIVLLELIRVLRYGLLLDRASEEADWVSLFE